MVKDSSLFNSSSKTQKVLVNSLIEDGIPFHLKAELAKLEKNRHYYLKLAYRYLKLKDFSEMQLFSSLAEKEQERIEAIIRWKKTS